MHPKQHKKSRKSRKTVLGNGPSLSRHYTSPIGSQVDLEQYLLSSTPASRASRKVPTTIAEVKIELNKHLPADLKGTLGRNGHINIPFDAIHRATNWRQALIYLIRLGATEGQIEGLKQRTNHRIIQRLKEEGRIVDSRKSDRIGLHNPTLSKQKAGAQEHQAVGNRKKPKLYPARIIALPPQQPTSVPPSKPSLTKGEGEKTEPIAVDLPNNSPTVKIHSEIANSEGDTILRSLSTEELFDLARGIRRQVFRKREAVGQPARSEILKEFAKRCANGICQFCQNPAQYNDTSGMPRLHVHHIIALKSGGEDSIENVVALCLNCHDIVHLRKDEKDAALLKTRAYESLSRLKKTEIKTIKL